MRVKVRLFAMLRERAGWRERDFDLSPGASVADAWQSIVTVAPALAPSRESVRFAVNRQYATPDEQLSEGDELVLIPPVAGGSHDEVQAALTSVDVRLQLTPDPLSDDLLAELQATVPTDADGALVVFVGRTRETPGTPAPGEESEAQRHAGKLVTGLDYEAFEDMAYEVMAAIAAEITARFGVRRLAIVHRVGRVAVGEPSVIIVAAAAHRAAAFDAARYAIDELKARAPIWKAEHYAGGSVWMGAPARESAAAGELAEEG